MIEFKQNLLLFYTERSKTYFCEFKGKCKVYDRPKINKGNALSENIVIKFNLIENAGSKHHHKAQNP